MHPGKKIKVLRTIHGLTQEDLGEKINKTRALVSSIEQTGKVNHHTLKSILAVFQMKEEEFEDYDGQYDVEKSEKLYEAEANERKLMLLKERLEGYQKENELLKKLVDSQQKMIKELKKKVKK